MSDEKRYTERGFRLYAERDRTEDELLYGAPETNLSVIESSIAFKGPHVWIFLGESSETDGVHLNLPEARLVFAALGQFIQEAVAGELTEKVSDE